MVYELGFDDLFLKPPGRCFDVGICLGLVLAFWSVLSFGRESGLPPLWPVRNSTFYISVNDS